MKKKFVSLGIAITLVSMVALLLNVYRIGEQNEVKSLTGKKQKMHSTIALARQREAEYRNDYALYPQPIGVNDIDRIQNTLISGMKAYGLEVVSITQINTRREAPIAPRPGLAPPPPGAAENAPPVAAGVTYEAAVKGKWDSVMLYLDGLQNGTILCQVKTIKMEASSTDDLVTTSFSYKLYTE